MVDVATPAFRGGAALARVLPGRAATGIAVALGWGVAKVPSGRRRIVARNIRRVRPDLDDRAVRRAVDQTFESYARYWVESFRLPTLSVEEVDRDFSVEGFEHVTDALAGGKGCILAVPHLGSWEWAGFWLARVQGLGVTVVVERLEPPELFEWFVELRRAFGFEVVALGPAAATACMRALRENRVVALLSDRDIGGGGVEVDLFGERTTLPGGPAVISMRSGAPIVPTAAYHRGHGIHGVVRPPIATERTGKLRADVARITQALAHELEALIRLAPEQWHLMQPNWPSDMEAA
jgi:phosphatidylinositol dimannoside acyltransferase